MLQNQELCVINGGKTTRYFPLKRGTQQLVVIFIKGNENVRGLTIFKNQVIYITYADDTTFLLSNKNSVTDIIRVFEYFSIFSGLRPNSVK